MMTLRLPQQVSIDSKEHKLAYIGCLRLSIVIHAYNTCESSIVWNLTIRHGCFFGFFLFGWVVFFRWSHDKHVITRKYEWMSHRLDAKVDENFTRKWNRCRSRNHLCMYIWVCCFKVKWRGVFFTRVTMCIHSRVWNVVRTGDKLLSVPTVIMMKFCTFWSLKEFTRHKPSSCHGDLSCSSADQAYDGLHWTGGQWEGRRNRSKGKTDINNCPSSCCFFLKTYTNN